MVFRYCLGLLLVSGAACADLCIRRIPNFWICLGWLCGIGYQYLTLQGQGVKHFAAGSLLPVILLWMLFYFRMLGAGDIKLLSVLGGFMGAPAVLFCVIWSVIFGAVLSVGVVILCGDLPRRLTYFTNYFKTYLCTGEKVPYRAEGDRAEHIHFSVAVLMSMLLWIGGFY